MAKRKTNLNVLKDIIPSVSSVTDPVEVKPNTIESETPLEETIAQDESTEVVVNDDMKTNTIESETPIEETIAQDQSLEQHVDSTEESFEEISDELMEVDLLKESNEPEEIYEEPVEVNYDFSKFMNWGRYNI